MFAKLLIANRGEIACRVIRTARRLGIATVAVYSEEDAEALHVAAADEAVCIGPPPSAQSYLDVARIVAAARATGADAVHPGYGFLSENPAFAAALADAGVVFVGPPAAAIEAMGDKITAKRLAERAGVSVIPGHPETVRDDAHALAVAGRIGYPVMLKAAAGGGGKGMRVAWRESECREGFARARSEARSSFGDDRVFVEKYIDQPRHIEIQILADAHGNVVHLGERECSVQRRHQKVLEEAPSAFIDAATREAMGAQAVALARAVDYRSAGTVEFIVDPERRFYFLEMNTRLQVEHPVTEQVTGLDLVEAMLRVAAGEPLAITQEQVRIEGWALEARVYAEDPVRGFLPSSGRLVRFRPPADSDGVRVDTGVEEGGVVSMHYDPMIAKLITTGATRDEALARMRDALDEFLVRGVAHNVDFLAAVVGLPRFREARLSTALIEEEFPDGYDPVLHARDRRDVLVAVAACVHRRCRARASAVGKHMPGGGDGVPRTRWVVLGAGERHEVRVEAGEGGETVTLAGRALAVVSWWRPGDALFRGTVAGAPVTVQVERDGPRYRLRHRGGALACLVLTPSAAALQALMPAKQPPDTSRQLRSPMPGLLVSVAVAPGDEVKAGQELAVVEAMKMENVLRAREDRRIAAVLVAPGASLAVDQPIIEFE